MLFNPNLIRDAGRKFIPCLFNRNYQPKTSSEHKPLEGIRIPIENLDPNPGERYNVSVTYCEGAGHYVDIIKLIHKTRANREDRERFNQAFWDSFNQVAEENEEK